MEIEFKYRVPFELFDAVGEDPVLRRARRIRMDAQYFDTPSGALRAASVTLRLRREAPEGEEGALICCVKMPAPNDTREDAALRRRLEYECEAPSVEAALPQLEAQGLDCTALRAALAEGLVVAAHIRYTRRETLVEKDGSAHTVCLDRGMLGKTPFAEVEVEYKSGDFAATEAAAHALAARYGLYPEQRGKYARALLWRD